ncbi:MAG: cell division protein FtsZ [Chthoniobacterales bacterium]
MIQLSHNYTLPEREDELIPIKVIGVGGAGCNALDRIVLDGLDKSDLIAINTDVQSLTSSVAAHKVQLGRTVTRGLGTGGDPEMGYEAAVDSADEIRQCLTDARMIFVCLGLGGGTGSGAGPFVAQLARESGALVIVFATLPFGFEGKRRTQQAQQALARLNGVANAVICFENDRMGDLVSPKAGIHQAFAVADITISQSVRSIINVIQRPGIIRIGFDDLLAALRSPNGRCLFGFGESDSDNRAHDALNQALKNPLMDRGRLLADAEHVLVQVAGGPGMTLSEVEILMQELGRHVRDHTQILFGTGVDGRMGNRLSVTIISSLAGDEESASEDAKSEKEISLPAATTPAPSPAPSVHHEPIHVFTPPAAEDAPVVVEHEPEPEVEIEAEVRPEFEPEVENEPVLAEQELPAPDLISFQEPEPEPVELPPPVVVPVATHFKTEMARAEPQPRLIVPRKKPVLVKEPKPEKVQAKQEVMQFEPVSRGRFEKSEPTIVEGQDLDVPTYLRKNIRVK